MLKEYDKLVKKLEQGESQLTNLQRQKDFELKQLENKYEGKIAVAMRNISKFKKLVTVSKEYVKEN